MAIKLGGGAATPQSLLLYPLDSDGSDASGTGNDLTLSGANISSAVAKYGGGSLAVGGSLGNWKGTGTMPALDGDFTCEFWLNLGASSTSNRYIVDRGEGSAFSYDSPGWAIGTGGSTIFLRVKDSYDAEEAAYLESLNISSTTTQSAIVGSWVHVAVVRQGNTYRLYINGTQEGSGSGSVTSFTAASFAIGAPLVNGSGMANGSYIDDFRLSGSAVYPDGTSFTPPTAAHPASAGSTGDIAALYLGSTAVSAAYLGSTSIWSAGGGGGDPEFANVALLLSFDGSGTSYVDSSSNGVSVANSAYNGGGDTQSTAQAKFGAASLLVNSSTAAAVEAPAVMPSGTQDFTFEFWHYSTQTSPYSRFLAGAGTIQAGTPGFELFDRSLEVNDTTLFSFAAPTNNVWQHVALVRQGNVFRLYRDGVELNNATSAATLTSGHNLYIGGQPYYGSSGFLAGYIDEVRLTLDVVRYPDGTTFTPPSEAFPVS